MKTQEELNALKEDVETVKEKLSALTDEVLEQVTGGSGYLPYHPVAFEALNNFNRHAERIGENMLKITTGIMINKEQGNPGSLGIDNCMKERLAELMMERGITP